MEPDKPPKGLLTMTRTRATVGTVLALLLAGCASTASSPSAIPTPFPSATPSPSPSVSPLPTASVMDLNPVFVVTSADFEDGGQLDARFSANAWGQCSGDNLNPQLSWEGAPEGTVAFAITMRDLSAGNWSHWVHVNIPADISSVATGASDSLPGVIGRNASPGVGYFGPCPPSPGHRYEFTVWALDAELDIPADPTYPNFFSASRDHVLAQASIIGFF